LHLDVKTAFLNNGVKKNVFMVQPKGFLIQGHEQKVCKLCKALYKLWQAPRVCYEKIDQYLQTQGLTKMMRITTCITCRRIEKC
jgi:hypothetical protein